MKKYLPSIFLSLYYIKKFLYLQENFHKIIVLIFIQATYSQRKNKNSNPIFYINKHLSSLYQIYHSEKQPEFREFFWF